jgi:hypothetical protein
MRTSDSTAALGKALAAALGELHNASKDSKNPHFKSSYASLASVIDATKGTLASHGLAAIQSPGWSDGRATVTTRILHSSGEWIEGTAEAPVVKADPQGVGSAITYLRRYALAAMCGITQEDDDGQAASRPAPKAAPKAKADPLELADALNKLGHLLGMAILDGDLTEKEEAGIERAKASGDLDTIRRAIDYLTTKREGKS